MHVSHRLDVFLLAVGEFLAENVELGIEFGDIAVEFGDVAAYGVDGATLVGNLGVDHHEVLQPLLHVALVFAELLLLGGNLLFDLCPLVLETLDRGSLVVGGVSVCLLLVDIPVVVVNFPVVKNWFMRLFMIFILYLNYSYNVNRFLGTSGVIKAIIRSGVIIALATFILAFFITRAWQLKFQWNLKLGKSKSFQWLALILLLIFSVWFAFFNSFVTLAPSLADLLCFWQWDFSTFEVTIDAVLMAINAGVFEETLRCLNLMILLVVMRNFKYQLILATVISSLLFSLSHLSNLGTSVMFTHFDLAAMLQQLIYTFGAGMLCSEYCCSSSVYSSC